MLAGPCSRASILSMASIPKVQTAVVIVSKDEDLQVRKDYPVKQPEDLQPGECLVKILATGVCQSDLHGWINDYPGKSQHPIVGGHEGVGEIVAIGAHTMQCPVKIGDRVGIKFVVDTCLTCEMCRKGREQLCPTPKMSGFTVDGTFQQYVVSYTHHVTPIPANVDSRAAASILCAGVTTYRALKFSGAQHGDWLVISGAGGGLGHLAMQYARVRGLRVIAIDTGAEKKALCEKLGAEAWIDFRETEDIAGAVHAATGGLGAQLALVTAGTGEGYKQAITYLRRGGTLVACGLPPTATLDASIYGIVVNNLTIMGSYVGTRQDAIEALDIVARGHVTVNYEMRGLSELQKVYEAMQKGAIAGRIVLDMEK